MSDTLDWVLINSEKLVGIPLLLVLLIFTIFLSLKIIKYLVLKINGKDDQIMEMHKAMAQSSEVLSDVVRTMREKNKDIQTFINLKVAEMKTYISDNIKRG